MWVMMFFFNDTATTEIYTLSLHDALPISAFPKRADKTALLQKSPAVPSRLEDEDRGYRDRKITRLNSSH